MRRLLFVFIVFCSCSCFAQLPNELLGVQVGFTRSQVDSVVSTFSKVKVNVDEEYGTIEVSGKFEFEGIKWNKLRVRTYEGIVREVQLEKRSKMSTISDEALGLMESYKERYYRYFDDLITKQDPCFSAEFKFNDKDTRELRISYYVCSRSSLYLTCSHYFNINNYSKYQAEDL